LGCKELRERRRLRISVSASSYAIARRTQFLPGCAAAKNYLPGLQSGQLFSIGRRSMEPKDAPWRRGPFPGGAMMTAPGPAASRRDERIDAPIDDGRRGAKWGQILYDLARRVEELRPLHGTARVLRMTCGRSASCSRGVALIPPAWQYPEIACARIVFDESEMCSPPSRCRLASVAEFRTASGQGRPIDVFYADSAHDSPRALSSPRRGT